MQRLNKDRIATDQITDQQEAGAASYKQAAENYRRGQGSKLWERGSYNRESYWKVPASYWQATGAWIPAQGY